MVSFFLWSCAASPEYPTGLRPAVEKLYISCRDLENVRSEILGLSQGYLYREGDSLYPIHAAAGLLQQANLAALSQWKLLSITDYIREKSREDFFTLRLADLRQSRREAAHLLLLLPVYENAMPDPHLLSLVAEGRRLIRVQIELYDELIQQLKPLSPAGPPWTWPPRQPPDPPGSNGGSA
ncbi:MAG: hypothetical protein ACOWWM_09330 [Desulfobacterales bacterium]